MCVTFFNVTSLSFLRRTPTSKVTKVFEASIFGSCLYPGAREQIQGVLERKRILKQKAKKKKEKPKNKRVREVTCILLSRILGEAEGERPQLRSLRPSLVT